MKVFFTFFLILIGLTGSGLFVPCYAVSDQKDLSYLFDNNKEKDIDWEHFINDGIHSPQEKTLSFFSINHGLQNVKPTALYDNTFVYSYQKSDGNNLLTNEHGFCTAYMDRQKENPDFFSLSRLCVSTDVPQKNINQNDILRLLRNRIGLEQMILQRVRTSFDFSIGNLDQFGVSFEQAFRLIDLPLQQFRNSPIDIDIDHDPGEIMFRYEKKW